MKKPWEQDVYRWCYTKAEGGARLDMRKGDWDKAALKAEVEAHDDIMAHTAMQNKLKGSRPSDHECDTNFYLQLKGIFFATIGYSRHRDPPGRTHGWVMFGAGCRGKDRKEYANTHTYTH